MNHENRSVVETSHFVDKCKSIHPLKTSDRNLLSYLFEVGCYLQDTLALLPGRETNVKKNYRVYSSFIACIFFAPLTTSCGFFAKAPDYSTSLDLRAASSVAGNLLTNGTFESGFSPWKLSVEN